MRTISKITLAIGILCLLAFAQAKPKAAVYIMGNPEGRDALRMAVNNFLIKSQKYQMIAVDALDVVAKEQNRQNSGSVTDGDIALLGRDAGAQYVCVVERSELDGISYVATRMVSVQSKVAELADMTELPKGGKIVELIEWQIGSMLGMPVGPRPGKATATAQAVSAQPVYTAQVQTQPAAPSIQGTVVPGANLAEKLAWLQRSADSHNTYILDVNADETIAPTTFEYSGAINITIVLRGVGGNRTLRLKSHGNMFIVKKNVTFILEHNITLHGHNGNTGSMVYVVESGEFKMNAGSTITGNAHGGVYNYGGTFIMNGGTISNNSTSDNGGGIYNRGTFTMSGGTISGNNASRGGGVYHYNGTFTMSGGTISGNSASDKGGGVLSDAAFAMRGGTIVGNAAVNHGGGVCRTSGDFTKTGGTITGYNSDPTNGNAVKDEGGNVFARRGHAVYVNDNTRKETTAGPDANLATNGWTSTGAWER
ncbi:MAG: hypothetical protein LBC87_05455 [Fibromonadaceae bacterium]|jgi:hypothetical protein|nr:hypothetical protein [Fibromonadaceae bacterium]